MKGTSANPSTAATDGKAEPELPQSSEPGPVTDLLAGLRQGDEEALNRLMSLLYPDLIKIARSQLRKDRSDHTLNSGALVHEVFLALRRRAGIAVENRVQLMGALALYMRHHLIDHARVHRARKRNFGRRPVCLDAQDLVGQLGDMDAERLLIVNDAIEKLAAVDPHAAEMVTYRYFAGATEAETAEDLGISPATVRRRWARAKRWLRQSLLL